MALSLGEKIGAGLERSCEPGEWVDAARRVDGVELLTTVTTTRSSRRRPLPPAPSHVD